MKEKRALSVIGFTATVIGFLASLLSKWVGAKEQEALISTEVEKAVTKRLGK